jgi:hypothetical protein
MKDPALTRASIRWKWFQAALGPGCPNRSQAHGVDEIEAQQRLCLASACPGAVGWHQGGNNVEAIPYTPLAVEWNG